MTNPSTSASAATILVRHQGLRSVSEEELIDAMGGMATLAALPRSIEVDTAVFAQDVENGGWGASHAAVWRHARELRQLMQKTPGARMVYGGIPEVPHVVALGAYLGDEWTVDLYDHHRETGRWGWLAPDDEQTLALEISGLPVERMAAAGPAVLRVEISNTVEDMHVREFVSESEEVAHIRIRPQSTIPMIGDRVRSPADVREVRRAVRLAISALVEHRPHVTTIHLFIAAPVSACFVTGQELRIRNNPPVQTYRYRRGADGGGSTRTAIRITAGGPTPEELPLTEAEAARAQVLRAEVWGAALRDVEQYALRKQQLASRFGAHGKARWYDHLVLHEVWQRVRPFAALPPVQQMIDQGATVDPVSMASAYFGYERSARRWRVSDRFLVRIDQAFEGDLARARTLVRLFMFHEALHVAHGITKAKVEEVGKFANGLEWVDYTSDLYAVLHELDRAVDQDPSLSDFPRMRAHVAELIDLVLRSFWAFEEPGILERMEIRRLRRYMNWYWQQIRVEMCTSPLQMGAVLARKPTVEIAGLEPQVESRRSYGMLRRFDRQVGLELGVVLDNEELFRIPPSPTVPLVEMLAAFSEHAHADLRQSFRQVFEQAVVSKHALPVVEDIP